MITIGNDVFVNRVVKGHYGKFIKIRLKGNKFLYLKGDYNCVAKCIENRWKSSIKHFNDIKIPTIINLYANILMRKL